MRYNAAQQSNLSRINNKEGLMESATTPPQLTVKAILLGIVLSMVLAGANAYLGLKVGMTVSASIPAAVISMATFVTPAISRMRRSASSLI